MQQSMMANAIQRGVLKMGATVNASAAMQSYAFVRAMEQTYEKWIKEQGL